MMMSAANVDGQHYGCDNCGCDSAHILACCQPNRCTGVQTFDLDAEFRRRFKLCEDYEEEDCDYAVSPEYSEYSEDYMRMTGSGASTTTLPPALLVDRLATLSVSSGDSFYLYDSEDDEDRCSISTLENVDNIDENMLDSQFPPSVRSSAVEEDREFNFLASSATTTVCRSASLKSTYGSKPSRSPRTKKVVRFADALGLDLESIRHILDFSDAPTTSIGRSPSDFGHLDGTAASAKVGSTMKLMVRFSEPGSSINFLRRVQERKVSLEEVSVDAERLTVSGVIRVANVAYQKQVTVRYSVDNWATYHDHTATYLPPGGVNSCYDGGLTDAFTFQLQLPTAMALGGRLEFSLRFDVGPDLTFWDSNFGANYAIDCVPAGKP